MRPPSFVRLLKYRLFVDAYGLGDLSLLRLLHKQTTARLPVRLLCNETALSTSRLSVTWSPVSQSNRPTVRLSLRPPQSPAGQSAYLQLVSDPERVLCPWRRLRLLQRGARGSRRLWRLLHLRPRGRRVQRLTLGEEEGGFRDSPWRGAAGSETHAGEEEAGSETRPGRGGRRVQRLTLERRQRVQRLALRECLRVSR